MEVVKAHGCICLVGPAIQDIAADALSFLQSLHTNAPASCQNVPLLGSTGTATTRNLANSLTAGHSCNDNLPSCDKGPSRTLQQTALEPESRLDEFRPHVTLVTKEEVAACTVSRSDLLQDFHLLDPTLFFPVGIAIADIANVLSGAAASCSEARMGAQMELSTGKTKHDLVCKDSTESLAQPHRLIG